MKRPLIRVEGDAPRWRHSLEFKQRVVEETLKSGASVARIARANSVNANQVFLWRKLYLEGELVGTSAGATCLVPVTVVADEPTAGLPAPCGHCEDARSGLDILGLSDGVSATK